MIVTSGPVILHIGDKADIDKEVVFNDGGSVSDLQVMLHQDAEFKAEKELEFTGIIYGPQAKKVEIEKDSTLTGAIVTGGEVKIEKDVSFTLTPAQQSEIGAVSTCPGSQLAHLAISHSGTGITCQAETVTIAAHQSDHSTHTGYTGTVALSTTTAHGDWSLITGASGLANSGNGAATYAFDTADNGQVVFGFSDTFIETVGMGVNGGGVVGCKTRERNKLQRLCHYMARPPIAQQRLSVDGDGLVVYELKHAFSNGTTHVLFEPHDFIARLAALVPRPRVHLIRYHGLFAPNARRRHLIVPRPSRTEQSDNTAVASTAPMTWMTRLNRVFGIDIPTCPKCGGKLRVIGQVTDPNVIARILEHVKPRDTHEREARAPPLSLAT